MRSQAVRHVTSLKIIPILLHHLAKKRLPSTGLPYCPQPTPEWQKSVRSFFSFTPKDNENKENQVDADIVAIDEISDNNTSKKSRKGKGPKKGKKV